MSQSHLYLLRLKAKYQYHCHLPQIPTSREGNGFFRSETEAMTYASKQLPPVEINPAYIAFMEHYSSYLYDSVTIPERSSSEPPRKSGEQWLDESLFFLQKHALPSLVPFLQEALVAKPPQIPDIYIVMQVLKTWWRESEPLMTNVELRLLWDFIDPQPYETIPIEFHSEVETDKALAAVNELLKPWRKTTADYPPLPSNMRTQGGPFWGMKLEYSAEGSLIVQWGDLDEDLPAPTDADAPPEGEDFPAYPYEWH